MEGKLCYTISEVAEMFDVNQSLIRFWETEFSHFITPKRNKRGVRFYSPKDIDNIRTIYHLVKEQNYTLKGAKAAMLNHKKTIVEEQQIPLQGDGFLKDNHKEVYNKLLEIRELAKKLLDDK